MNRRLATLLLAAAPVLAADAALALDFKADGYYRNRWRYYEDASIDRVPRFTVQDPDAPDEPDQRIPARQGKTTEFLDQRLMLNTTLTVTDGVRVYGQFRVLDNVLFGDNGGPAPVDLPGIGGSLFSQETDDTLRDGREEDDLKVERVWAEVDWRRLTLAFGRQGSHWGMGLFQDQGNRLEWGYEGQGDDFGDTVDRVKLVWNVSDAFHLIAAYDRISERGRTTPDAVTTNVILGVPTFQRAAVGGIDVNRDDVDEGVFAALYETEGGALGLYNTYRQQTGNDAWMYVADVYAMLRAGIATLSSEVVYAHTEFSEFRRLNSPDFVDVVGDQYGGVLRLDLDTTVAGRPAGLRLEWGFASGPGHKEFGETVEASTAVPLIDPDDPLDVSVRTTQTPNLFGDDADAFSLWSRDYDVDILLFNEYVGRVKNADYLKLVAHCSPVETVDVYASALWARTKRNALIFVREDQVGPETFANAERIFLLSPTFSDPDLEVIQDEGLALAARYPGGMVTGRVADQVGAKDLGWEFDAGVSWRPMQAFKMELEGAILLPGEVFNNRVTRALTGRNGAPIYGLSAQWAVLF